MKSTCPHSEDFSFILECEAGLQEGKTPFKINRISPFFAGGQPIEKYLMFPNQLSFSLGLLFLTRETGGKSDSGWNYPIERRITPLPDPSHSLLIGRERLHNYPRAEHWHDSGRLQGDDPVPDVGSSPAGTGIIVSHQLNQLFISLD